eukprot:6647867-Pyramimonas_sp.AAC.1
MLGARLTTDGRARCPRPVKRGILLARGGRLLAQVRATISLAGAKVPPYLSRLSSRGGLRVRGALSLG